MPFCPACHGALRRLPRYGTEIETCEACQGTWLEGNELDAIIDYVRQGHAKDWEARFDAPSRPHSGELFCPKCEKSRLVSFLYTMGAGIELDRCPGCGGIWFDYGELERVAVLVAGLSAPLDLPFF